MELALLKLSSCPLYIVHEVIFEEGYMIKSGEQWVEGEARVSISI